MLENFDPFDSAEIMTGYENYENYANYANYIKNHFLKKIGTRTATTSKITLF